MKLEYQKGELQKLGRTKITLPEELTPKLAYLVGALRDGSISQTSTKEGIKEYSAWCSKSKEYLEGVIAPFLSEIFGIKPRVVSDRDKFQVRTSIHAIVRFFQRVFEHPTGKQTSWKIPQVILQADKEIKSAYIRGFFDAEGSVLKLMEHYPWQSMYPIRIWSAWATPDICIPLEELKSILKEFGIKSEVKRMKPSSERTKLPIFCLKISQLEDKLKFVEEIGSLHPLKIDSLLLLKSFGSN